MKKFLLATLAAGMLAIGISTPAYAAGNERIDSISNEYKLEADGTLKVKENITYTFDGEKHGLLRSFAEQTSVGASKFRIYPHGDFTVTDETGEAIPYTKASNGSFLDLKIGDPQKTISGTHTYVLTYMVKNTVATSSDGLQGFSWNPTGTNWSVPIGTIKASFIDFPATVTPPTCNPAACTIAQNGNTTEVSGVGRPFDVSFSFAPGTFPNAQVQLVNNPNYIAPDEQANVSNSPFSNPWFIGVIVAVIIAIIGFLIAIFRNNGYDSYSSSSTGSTTYVPPTPQYFSQTELGNIAATLTTRGHIYSKDPKGDVLYRKGEEYLNDVEKKVIETGFGGAKSVTASAFKNNLKDLFIEKANYAAYLSYINGQAQNLKTQAQSHDYSSGPSTQTRSLLNRSNDYSSDISTQLLIASLFMNQPNIYGSTGGGYSDSSSSSSSSNSSSSSSSYDYGSSSSYSSYDSGSSYSSDSGSSSSSDGGGSW